MKFTTVSFLQSFLGLSFYCFIVLRVLTLKNKSRIHNMIHEGWRHPISLDRTFWHLKNICGYLCWVNKNTTPNHGTLPIFCIKTIRTDNIGQTSGCILKAQRNLPIIWLQLKSPMKKGNNARHRFSKVIDHSRLGIWTLYCFEKRPVTTVNNYTNTIPISTQIIPLLQRSEQSVTF